MGEVTISVAGRAYQVICEDGEEDRLASIATRVDAEAQVFSGAAASLSEARLLLMCSLLLADKLDEAEKAGPTAPAAATPSPTPVMAEIDTSGVDEATARLTALLHDSPAAPDSAADEPFGEEEDAPDAEQEAAPARPSKSSAATAAEKDLLSWLDKPEPRERPPAETLAAEPDVSSAEVDEPAETVEGGAEAGTDSEPEEAAEMQPDTPQAEEAPEESEDDREARERSERRARRRARLSRLTKEDESND